MKTVALVLVFWGLATVGLAQTNQTDVLIGQPVVSVERLDRYIQFQTRTIDQVFGLNVGYGGVVPMIREAENPWHLINPFAPAAYGSGFDNLSLNPHTARPEGIHLFLVRF
jgi:hypothetical protein